MKKVLLSLAVLAGAVSAAHAQEGIRFGVKAGGSLTTLSGKDVEDISSKFGFHAGAVANFGINDMFSVQPELLYSQKGAQDKDNSKVKLKLNYVDVPVLLRLNADGLFFEAGPQVGFLLAAKGTDGTNSLDIKEGYKSVDFGYAAGLGYQMPDGGIGVGLRYNGGFANVPKDITFGSTTTEIKARNSAFQLYLSYMFGGK